MITIRCVRRFGEARPVDSITAAELRAWLLELRNTLCGRPLLLSNSEASAARSGRPVHHGTCWNQLDIAAILTIEQRAANA